MMFDHDNLGIPPNPYDTGNLQQAQTAAPDTLRGAISTGQVGIRYATPADEAEKKALHHSAELDKAYQAQRFFRDNPAFSEFILLIRSGAIQI